MVEANAGERLSSSYLRSTTAGKHVGAGLLLSARVQMTEMNRTGTGSAAAAAAAALLLLLATIVVCRVLVVQFGCVVRRVLQAAVTKFEVRV